MTLTAEIFKLSAPYDNPYQGKDYRVLFVCSAGLLRSATAANFFARKGYNTRSAGSAPYALVPLSANLIHWAQNIVFVNQENYEQALNTFDKDPDLYHMIQDKAQVLKIPDNFEYNNPVLISMLEDQVAL
jgi:predicted protein tyrosine phosphatase